MKDWRAYISRNLGSDIWGFIALDYYEKQKSENTAHPDPSQFIDDLIEQIPNEKMDSINFHRVLLCISAQLLGNDFDEVVGRSLKFIEKQKDKLSPAEIIAMSAHYNVYNKASVFLEKVKAKGIAVTDALEGLTEEKKNMTTITNHVSVGKGKKPIKLFYSYAHEDEKMRDKMEKHLSLLRREGLIKEWHDKKIMPGVSFDDQIDENLKKADVILLMVSQSFMDSDYCFSIEMNFALEQEKKKAARVVPIILRTCDWESAPFAKLKALPKDGKAITKWRSQDDGYTNVAKELRLLIESL